MEKTRMENKSPETEKKSTWGLALKNNTDKKSSINAQKSTIEMKKTIMSNSFPLLSLSDSSTEGLYRSMIFCFMASNIIETWYYAYVYSSLNDYISLD
ncbi:MAG: hypothetical protein ACLFVP_06090 [Candidatus Bathyarchaeia archaeon]